MWSYAVMSDSATSERARERKFQGARRPGSERARERKGQGAKVPGSELARVLLADSLRGANWPESEKARYRNKSHPEICNNNGTFDKFFIHASSFITLTSFVIGSSHQQRLVSEMVSQRNVQ